MGRTKISWDDKWLIKNLDSFSSIKALVIEYNKAHDTCYKYDVIKSHLYSSGIRKVNPGSSFSNEELDFFKNNYPNMFTNDFIDEFKNRFGKQLTKGWTTTLARRMGLNKSSEQMQKAILKTLESTTYAEGTVGYLTKGKYENIKTKDGWMLRSRYEYQKLHNEILDDNDAIIFADGNTKNYDKDNLIKVPSKYVTLIYNTLGISNDAKELVKPAIVWCELYSKLKNIEKDVDKCANI